MQPPIFVRKNLITTSSQPAAVVESITPPQQETIQTVVTASTTPGGLKQHMKDLLLSMLGVMIMAALQAGLSYMQQSFPDAFAGISQAGAAFAAIKLLGR